MIIKLPFGYIVNIFKKKDYPVMGVDGEHMCKVMRGGENNAYLLLTDPQGKSLRYQLDMTLKNDLNKPNIATVTLRVDLRQIHEIAQS